MRLRVPLAVVVLVMAVVDNCHSAISAPQTTIACEFTELNIECEFGFINLISANYGRLSYEICNPDGINWQTNCKSATTFDIVSARCSGERSCNVAASNTIFGDPCGGVIKYLELTYACATSADAPPVTTSALPAPTTTTTIATTTDVCGVPLCGCNPELYDTEYFEDSDGCQNCRCVPSLQTTSTPTTGCLNNMGKLVGPGSTIFRGGCLQEICRNSTWELDPTYIDLYCAQCRVFNDPHFKVFNGIEFDWHIGCNHALVQEGTSFTPPFGVFMDFNRAGKIAMVGPTTYREDSSTTVELIPGSIFSVTVFDAPLQLIGLVNPITPTPTFLVGLGSTTTVKAWTHGSCIRLYGIHKILVELCSTQITIWASKWGIGPANLAGLCGSPDPDALGEKKLVARNGTKYNHPAHGWLQLCDANFGFSWQVQKAQQSKKLTCPAAPGANLGGVSGRRKRDTKDAQTNGVMQVCGNVTNSPDREQCLNVITDIDPDMFFNTCMFDLCVATKYPETGITYDDMLKQVRQINVEAKEQADETIDLTAATEAPTTPLPTSPPTQLSTQDETQQPIPTPSPSDLAKKNVIVQIIQRVRP